MPKIYSVNFVLKVLESKNFFFVSQTGSHAKYRNNNSSLTVIVPIHGKDIRHGTFRSILRQGKLKESDFNKKKK